MTAQEKFYARLKELGIEAEFGINMHVGTVLPDGRVIVLVHDENDESDPYTEYEFPPYEELWKNEKFREECKKEFYKGGADDEFVAKLACWLDLHDSSDKCPLWPVDLYWLPGGFETKWFNYQDDQETAEDIIKNLVKEHSVA